MKFTSMYKLVNLLVILLLPAKRKLQSFEISYA